MKFLAVFIILISYCNVFSQSKKIKQVNQSIDNLKSAMINADSVVLDKLTAFTLSYGHSGGAVDDKRKFIEKIVSGKSDFVSILLSEQTISIDKNVAIVRHKLDAVTNDNGTPGEVHLKVLLIWRKYNKQWKLIARQAVKI